MDDEKTALEKKEASEIDESIIKKRLLLSTFVIIVFPGAFIFFIICAMLVSKFTGINQDKLIIAALAAFVVFIFLFLFVFACVKFREFRKKN